MGLLWKFSELNEGKGEDINEFKAQQCEVYEYFTAVTAVTAVTVVTAGRAALRYSPDICAGECSENLFEIC